MHQPISRFVWQRLDQCRLGGGEDGRGSAQAEANRQHNRGGEHGSTPDLPDGVAHILQQRVDHSVLNAIIGSTRAARGAGSQHANSATPSNNEPTAPKVSGSCGLTPTSMPRTSVVSAGASIRPTSKPIAAGEIP